MDRALQPIGLQRVRHNRVINNFRFLLFKVWQLWNENSLFFVFWRNYREYTVAGKKQNRKVPRMVFCQLLF